VDSWWVAEFLGGREVNMRDIDWNLGSEFSKSVLG
jgi:hypothetical protein